MAKTIYATFLTEHDAEKAAGALLDHGIKAADISFVVPEGTLTTSVPAGATITPVPGTSTHPGQYIAAPDNPSGSNAPTDFPIPDLAVPPAPSTPRIYNSADAPPSGHEAGGILSDTGTYDPLGVQTPGAGQLDVATSVQSGLHTAPSLAAPVYAGGIPANVADPDAVITNQVNTPTMPHTVGDGVTRTQVNGLPASGITTMAADSPIDAVNADRHHVVDNERTLPTAATGITTTTAADAGKGALEGAGIGLGLGALLGLAAIAIPGIGLVAGAGALIAGLAAATGAAGGVAGAALGYLADQGVPPDHVNAFENHIKGGGPLLSIGLNGNADEVEVMRLLTKYGATSAQAF